MMTLVSVLRHFLVALAAVACTAPVHAELLTVVLSGEGGGRVTSAPRGIDCGTTCSADFRNGTQVTLTATPAPGSTFNGWSGSTCRGTTGCTVTMTSAQTVTANFALIPPLGSAVGNNLLDWTTSGNAPWSGQTQVFLGGGAAARSGPIGDNEVSTLSTGFSGPATLTFWWKVSSEANRDFLTFYINGVAQPGPISGEVDWTRQVVNLPAGYFTFEWRYSKDGSGNVGQDAAWLDNVLRTHQLDAGKFGTGRGSVTSNPSGIDCGDTCRTTSASFTNGTEVTLTAIAAPGSTFTSWSSSSGASCFHTAPTCKVYMDRAQQMSAEFMQNLDIALDNSALIWTTSGDNGWRSTTRALDFVTGGSAAVSGDVWHNGRSTLSATVTGPGILGFWWKVSSREGDVLDFRINGTSAVPSPISGEVDWNYRVFNIPDGNHVLEWRFSNDYQIFGGRNAGWVDGVSFSRNPRDFNANGSSDLLWQNTSTGDRYAWFMNGAIFASDAFIANVPVDWRIAGTGDFNADGKPDIVWENTVNGDRYLWFMNGSTFVSDAALFNVAADWRIAAVADFNNDGKPDIAWENKLSGLRYVWFMNGTTFSSDAYVGFASTDWSIVGAGDFNADGRTDTVLQNTSTGQLWVWFLNAGAYVSGTGLGTLPAGWSVAGVGDYNADAKPDLVLQNLTTGGRYIWFMNGTTFAGDANLGALPTVWSIAP